MLRHVESEGGNLDLTRNLHGLRIKPVSVLESNWFCEVESDEVLRLGLCYVRGMRREDGERIVAERLKTTFSSLVDFQLRTALPQNAARALAKIGALNGRAEHRRDARGLLPES